MRIVNHIILVLALALLTSGCAKKPPKEVIILRVMAPQYLKGILEKPAEQFYKENHIKVKLSFEYHDSIFVRAQADPLIDIFISNYPDSFEKLKKDSLMLSDKYSSLFRIGLVAIGRPDGEAFGKLSDLKKDHFRRVVIVNPDRDYEGQLGRQILREHHIFKKIGKKLVMANSAEHLITYITSDEADAAILLESSLNKYENIPVVLKLEDKLESYLLLSGAITERSKHPKIAQAFLDLFKSRLCEIYDHRGIYLVDK